MIKVENLTKRYAGGFTAVDNISFEVGEGEIVGFLGPNGAGKSTTMRMLSSFMPATSGRASINGHDVFEDSLRARACIGYLPENVPLYTDMRVSEYLAYRGGLKGVGGKRLKSAIGEVAEMCNLTEVSNKIIGNLSKGFRQRVGLAETLLGDPKLLILDEPTIGLDPNQIRQVRELIRNLGNKHTILLSTHILPEVEMTCSRVLIINKGKIQASDSPQNLVSSLRSAGGITLEAKTGADNGVEILKALPKVRDVSKATDGDGGWQTFRLRVEANADIREELFRLVIERKWTLRELHSSKATLEDVFVEITHND